MALFKIFKGSNTAKITNSSATGYITPTDGYAYYDTGSKLFYIDAAYSGTTISRQPINADNATNGIFYGTCDTAQATKTKVATLTNGTGFSLKAGTIVAIKFTQAAAASTMTLNVNGTGAKNLYQYGTTLMNSGTTTTGWPAGAVVPFVYDGTYWFRLYWTNTGTVTSITPGNGLLNGTGTSAITTTGTLNLNYGTSASAIGTTSAAGSANTVSRSDHVHNITLATGDNNGQVKIAGQNIDVKGLGSNAYTSTAYLPLSGGTMTGILKAFAAQYTDDYTTCGINMQNSDIVGLNSIYTSDTSDGAAQGIHFYRDATHVDTLWINGGDLLFVPNRALGTNTTKANSQKVGRFIANPTSGQVVITDGTTGGLKSSGYTIAASVPSGAKFTDTTYPNAIQVYNRTSIGTSPNFDNPGINGLFEIRSSTETTGESGTKPFNGYGAFFSAKTPDNIAMLQLAGNNSSGWYIRGKYSANVTLSGVAWDRLVTNSGTWAISTTGNAATATKLGTARTIQTNLASTSSASFDGSANITPGVTGTLGIANGGTGATTASGAVKNLIGTTAIGSSEKPIYWNGSAFSPISNKITLSSTGTNDIGFSAENTSKTHKVSFIVGGSSGSGGVYDNTYSKWLVYSDTAGNVQLNGNALTATKATKDSDGFVIPSTYVKLVAGTSIPASSATHADLNALDWQKTGSYCVSVNANIPYIDNLPSDYITTLGGNQAFMMNVYSPLSSDGTTTSGEWIYRIQEIIPFQNHIYRWRRMNSTGGSGTWVFGAWTRQVLSDTDTKNTAGSTDTSSKIYLIGATSQAANPQTYSDNQIYATNGQLDANKVRIAEAISLVYDSTNQALNFVFA